MKGLMSFILSVKHILIVFISFIFRFFMKIIHYPKLNEIIQTGLLIVTGCLFVVTILALKETKKTTQLAYMPLISICQGDIQMIHNETFTDTGIVYNIEFTYKISSYGNTPAVNLCAKDTISDSKSIITDSIPDTTYMFILNPSDSISYTTEHNIIKFVQLYNDRDIEKKTYKDIFDGYIIYPTCVKELENETPLYLYINLNYNDLAKTKYEYSTSYKILIREENQKLFAEVQPLRSYYEIMN